MSIEYYILDTETTGLSLDVHEINQISVMRVSDTKQVSLQIAVAHPNIYNSQALEIQGITPKDLLKGMPIQEAVKSIDLFLEEDGKTRAHRCILAHNAAFDRKFVNKAWERLDKELQADLWLCTQSFAKRYVKKFGGDKIAKAQFDAGIDIKKDKLGKLKPKFGLNNFMVGVGLEPKLGAHSADVDVKNTLTLYNWLMNSKTEYISLIERTSRPKVSTDQDLDISDF